MNDPMTLEPLHLDAPALELPLPVAAAPSSAAASALLEQHFSRSSLASDDKAGYSAIYSGCR